MKKNKSQKPSRFKISKPEWDGTVTDLNVHKLSADELLQRKLDYISNNHVQIAYPDKPKESVFDRIQKTRYGNKPKSESIQQQKQMMSKTLISNKELNKCVNKSQNILASVEEMFGNHSQRYQVEPVVTMAPKNSNLNALDGNYYLNESDPNEDDETDDDDHSNKSAGFNGSSYTEVNDYSLKNTDEELNKFRKFIEEERHKDKFQEQILEKKQHTIVNNLKQKHQTVKETQTPPSSDDGAYLLKYITDKLSLSTTAQQGNNSCHNYDSMNDNDKTIGDNFIQTMNMRFNEINERIDQLETNNETLVTENKQNKELIDALTLELLKSTDRFKTAKQNYDNQIQVLIREISEIKGVLLKTLLTPSMSEPVNFNKTSSSNIGSFKQQNVEIMHDGSHTNKNKDDKEIEELLKQLKSKKEEESRLKNLMKISQSLHSSNE